MSFRNAISEILAAGRVLAELRSQFAPGSPEHDKCDAIDDTLDKALVELGE